MEGLVLPTIRARSLRYRFVPASAELTAFADREKVQQIVLNLLSNAIKYTSDGGEIELSISETEEAAQIHVRDSGRGIPAARFEHIFAPFVRIDTGYARPTEGTGLGLAIGRDLARAMGGDITVASVLGEGSTFRLHLP